MLDMNFLSELIDRDIMPNVDMNELLKRDPKRYHQMLMTTRQGELRVAKVKLENAMNSVERDKASRGVERLNGEVRYHTLELEKLEKKASGSGT